MDIKVLGLGCRKCKLAEEIVRQAVAESVLY
ncbi:MAG: thioredoxin family protein [Syntrophaceae bacterium]